jgi:hypothetical protein
MVLRADGLTTGLVRCTIGIDQTLPGPRSPTPAHPPVPRALLYFAFGPTLQACAGVSDGRLSNAVQVRRRRRAHGD